MTRSLLFALALTLAASGPALAQQAGDDHVTKGDYLFKTGYYLKASEHYRLALLDDPSNPHKKLAFGNALFAIGNYSYASYALRRGVAELDPREAFQPDVAGLFPSRRAFTQALRDLKRYVTYSPRDPAGLSVLGYVLYAVRGEERRCRDMFLYLRRLDPEDPYAAFFLSKLSEYGALPPHQGVNVVPPLVPVEEPAPVPERVEPPAPMETPEAPPVVVAPPPAPPPERVEVPPVKDVIPPPERSTERAGSSDWPSPVPALSE
jgi:tetratricopeptide (TPR) repeat protein